MNPGLPHLVQGEFRLKDRDDLAPVLFRMRLGRDYCNALVWTDDGRLDYALTGHDGKAATIRQMESMIETLATWWLKGADRDV